MKRIALLLAAAALGGGCLTPGKIEPTLRYTVEPEPTVVAHEPTARTLGVRPLAIARAYAQPMMVYHGEGAPLEARPNAEWAERPEAVVTRALMDALSKTGRFSDVGDAASMRPPTYILTGEVRHFRENRAGARPMAEIEVRLELREAMGRGAPWAKTLRHEVALADDTPGALAVAMTEAVENFAEEAATEIADLDMEVS